MRYTINPALPRAVAELEIKDPSGATVGALRDYGPPSESRLGRRYHAMLHILPGTPLIVGGLAQGHGSTVDEAITDAVKKSIEHAALYSAEVARIGASLGVA